MSKMSLHDQPISPRLVISGCWTSMLFVFAYVDIFALMRRDVAEGILAGEVAGVGFTIDQTFLTATTLYIVIPSVLVFLTLVLPAGVVRVMTMVAGVVYTVSIALSMIGETWVYYLMGSVIEMVLLAAMVAVAWRWPRAA